MSREYNLYLSEKLIEYFQQIHVKAGKKYYAKFDNIETRDDFYYFLKEYAQNESIYKEFIYSLDSNYKTFAIKIWDTFILVAKEDSNVTLDFLIKFRNSVGEGRDYPNFALLLLISSDLDSIMDGTESLHRDGLPFFYSSIITDIENRIKDNSYNLSAGDKAIIKVELNSRKADKYSDKTSLELYKPILEMINSGVIKKNQYKSFSMFYDSELETFSVDNIERRIAENRGWFQKIEDAIRTKNVENELTDKIGNTLLTKFERLEKDLFKDEWSEQFDYKQILKSITEKKAKENLAIDQVKIIFAQSFFCVEDENYFRYKSYKTNQRNKKESWLIFNDDTYNSLNFIIELSDKIRKSDIKYESGLKPDFDIDGKKVKCHYSLDSDTSFFSKISMMDTDANSRIEINICVIGSCKTCFNTIIPKVKEIDAKRKQIKLWQVEDDIKFNVGKADITTLELSNGFRYVLEDDSCLELQLTNFLKELDKLFFYIVVAGMDIKICIELNQEKSTVITGVKLFREKLSGKKYVYDLVNKVSNNKVEYRLEKHLKDSLDYESQIIRNGIVQGKIKNGKISNVNADLPHSIRNNYIDIISYYSKNDTLPSLCPLNDELIALYKNFISSINELVDSIPDNIPITDTNNKNVFLIGSLLDETDNVIYLSPLHPVNIAHQLALFGTDINSGMDLDIVKKLNSRFSYPYFYVDTENLYKVVDNNESLMEWKKYILSGDTSKNGARYFVSRLVNDKIDLFVKHFGCMFSEINNNVLNINLVNMGDCSEVFEGLINYYINAFNNESYDETKKIIVCIYNEALIKNSFDILANENLFKKYVSDKFDPKKANLNELIAFIKDKLSHYVKLTSDKQFKYAHLSFYEMPSQISAGSNNMNNIDSGVSLNGILSGLTSKFMGDSYRTSFGAKDIRKNMSSDLYRNMNALALYSRRSDPFSHNGCISTEVKNEKALILKKVYDSSHWVTFIDPKVDLNFFASTEDGEKLTVIHYSDQYTTTSGYDAITVTNKTQQYINLIREHMSANHLSLSDDAANRIINAFNAINGNWLLNLISSEKRYEKEKISLISAVKLAMAKFKTSNILWVPMAMEEILRVTGAVKLSTSQGILSAKNLGAEKGSKSDDLLMVGIDLTNQNALKVYLHPIEVKIGEESYICSSKVKAKNQVEATRKKILDKNLGEDADSNIIKALRRNYLMQLVIISAQKLKLYNIWKQQDWDVILSGPIREKLLNEDYVISNDLDDQIGIGSIIQFANVNDDKTLQICKEDGCTIIQSTVQYALKILSEDVEDIVNENSFNEISTLDEMVKETVENAIHEDIVPVTEDAADNKNLDADVGESVISREINMQIDTSISNSNDCGMNIVFGSKKNGTSMLWHPNDTNKIMHTNTGIIGTMGTGKTQFTKSLITQLHRQCFNNVDSSDIGILIFDYKGDYNLQKQDFIEATGAKVYSLYHLPFNPLSISTTAAIKPMLPLHIANTFKETLAKAYGLGVKQETLLRDVIMDAYSINGIEKANSATWTKPAPTFKDVYNLYSNRDGLKEDSLYAAMTAIDEFEIFEPDVSLTKSLYDLIDGVTVIDLSGYDMQIQNLVVAITLDLFYSQMQAHGHSKIVGNLRQLKKIVLVDEADNFLSQGFSSIKKILKEGREFGVGTILSTQLLSHFSNENDDFANYIFTWVIHNVSDLSSKDVKKIFNTQSKPEEEKLYRDIKNLQKHHSIVKFSSDAMPEYIEDLPFYKLI